MWLYDFRVSNADFQLCESVGRRVLCCRRSDAKTALFANHDCPCWTRNIGKSRTEFSTWALYGHPPTCPLAFCCAAVALTSVAHCLEICRWIELTWNDQNGHLA